MHDEPAPRGGCYLRCYNGKVSDERGTVGRGSPVPSCFKLHPGSTVKIVLDPIARTATFFVNGMRHPHVARGVRAPARPFFFTYSSDAAGVEARCVAMEVDANANGQRRPPPSSRDLEQMVTIEHAPALQRVQVVETSHPQRERRPERWLLRCATATRYTVVLDPRSCGGDDGGELVLRKSSRPGEAHRDVHRDALSLGPLRLRPNSGAGGWPRTIEVEAGGATELHLEWSPGIPPGARGDALLASGERLPWGMRATVVAHVPTRRPASAAVAARQLQAALARGIAQRLVFALNRPPGGLGQVSLTLTLSTLTLTPTLNPNPDPNPNPNPNPNPTPNQGQGESARLTLRQLAGGGALPDEPEVSDGSATARAAALGAAAIAAGAPAAVGSATTDTVTTTGGSSGDYTAAFAATTATAATASAAAGPDWASLKELAEHILVLGPRAGRASVKRLLRHRP